MVAQKFNIAIDRGFVCLLNMGMEAGWLINAETEHLEECLAFINAAADPMFYLETMYGPEGDIWQCEGNVVTLTDSFKDWLKENGVINFYPIE